MRPWSLPLLCVGLACGGSGQEAPGPEPGNGPEGGVAPGDADLSISGPAGVESSACAPLRLVMTATGTPPLTWGLSGSGALGLTGRSPRLGVFEVLSPSEPDGQGRQGTVTVRVRDAEGRTGQLEFRVQLRGAPDWLTLQRPGGFDLVDLCDVFPSVYIPAPGLVDARIGRGWLTFLRDQGDQRMAARVDLRAGSPEAETIEEDADGAIRIRPVDAEGSVLLETEQAIRWTRPETEPLVRPLGALRHLRVGLGPVPRFVLLDGVRSGLLVEPERGRDTELRGIRDVRFGDNETLLVEGVPGLGRIDLGSRQERFYERATLDATSPGGRWIVEASVDGGPLRFVPTFQDGRGTAVEAFSGRPEIVWSPSQRLAALRVGAARWASLLEVHGRLRRVDFETGFASAATVTAARRGPVLAFVAEGQASIRFRRIDRVESRTLPSYDALLPSPSGALVVGDTAGVDRVLVSESGETLLLGLGPARVEAQGWREDAELLMRAGFGAAGQAQTWLARFGPDGEVQVQGFEGWPLVLGPRPASR